MLPAQLLWVLHAISDGIMPAKNSHRSARLRATIPSDVGHLHGRLDRSSGSPLYYQLAEQIRNAISTGALESGARIGNEIMLARDFGVSRPTTRRAIKQLVDEGLLVRKPGVGTSVVSAAPSIRSMRLTSLFDDLDGAQQSPETRVLSVDIGQPTAEVAAALLIAANQSVLRLRRLRMANHEPLAIMENYLPGARVDVSAVDFVHVGLYQAMRAAGIRLRGAKQRIGARQGTAEECRLLQDPAFSPVITMDRLTHDDTGLPVEWGRHVFRANRYEFTMTLVGNAART
jgi:DNA-binding GntR family transcriptional regulator